MSNIRFTRASYWMRNCISNRSWHCKTWTIYIFDPYSLWSAKSSSVILSLQNFSTSCYYPLFLSRQFWFMICRQLLVFYFFGPIWIIIWNHYDSWVTTISSKNLVARKESRSKSWSWELNVKLSVIFEIILTFDDSIIQRISYYFLLFLLQYFRSFFFFFWIWFRLNLFLLLFTYSNKFCNIICKLHFNQQRTLCSILTMTIANREKMLMECLTHIWRQYKVILILFIWIINTVPFSCGVSKSRYHISINTLRPFIFIKPFDFKRCLCSVLNSIMVVYSLVWKNCVRIRVCLSLRRWWTFYHLLYNLLWR